MKKGMNKYKVFFSYFMPHIKLFILDMFCALMISLIDLAFPFVSRFCMYELLPEGAYKTFFVVMIVIVISQIIRSIFSFIIGFYGHRFGILVETDMRRDVFKHIQTLGFDFFDNIRVGQLLSRLTTDLFDITELAHHGPEDIFISVITIIGAIVILFTIEWRLAIVIAVFIPVYLIVVWKYRFEMMKASRKLKASTALVNADFESNLSGIRTAKAFANEESELDKFEKANIVYRNAKYGLHFAMSRFNAVMEFFLSILPVIVIAVGGFLIMRKHLNVIDLITFSLYVTTFIVPIRKLSTTAELFTTGIAGLDRFTELMNTKSNLTDKAGAVELKNVKGNIVIKDVSFTYKNYDSERNDEGNNNSANNKKEEKQIKEKCVDEKYIEKTKKDYVLKNINLNINEGETVALVGPSGGGKTTLVQLILRFYDTAVGEILIDNQNVKDITQESLHKNIGVVQQDVFLFPATIEENIRYGKPNATHEEVVEAAKMAEVYDDIMHMPEGFNSYVGDRGVLLSGGQKQRISIARIFLKNPKILILDEATSALDSVTEFKIQKTFDKLSKGRTTIVIAHRLSTVKNADRIVVIENGMIEEMGTHDELINKNGIFAKLVSSQEL